MEGAVDVVILLFDAQLPRQHDLFDIVPLENKVLLLLHVLDSGVQVTDLAGTLEHNPKTAPLQLVQVVAKLGVYFLGTLSQGELNFADQERVF